MTVHSVPCFLLLGIVIFCFPLWLCVCDAVGLLMRGSICHQESSFLFAFVILHFVVEISEFILFYRFMHLCAFCKYFFNVFSFYFFGGLICCSFVFYCMMESLRDYFSLASPLVSMLSLQVE